MPALPNRAMPRRAAAKVAVAVVVVAASVAGYAPAALSAWAGSSSESHTLSTGTLAPPTNPATAAGTCVLLVGNEIVVSWTRTASTWADGYEVLRSTTSGGPYSVVATVAGQATESYTDSGLAFSTTYHYVVRATRGSWRSDTTAQVSRKTRSSLCL